jgi:signal transduction histidine kinase
MRIRTRLHALGLATILVAAVAGAVVSWAWWSLHRARQNRQLATLAVRQVCLLNTLTYEYVQYRGQRPETQWRLVATELSQALAGLRPASEAEDRLAAEVWRACTEVAARFRELQENRQASADGGTAAREEWGRRLVGQLMLHCEALVLGAHRLAEAADAQELALQRTAGYMGLASVAMLAAISASTSVWLAGAFLRRVERLHQGIEVIAAGDLDSRIRDEAPDELGACGRAFDGMAERLNQSRSALQAEIAERQRAEQSLKQTALGLARTNHELQQFAYVASHDVQEPLRAIAGYLQLLARRYQGQLGVEADGYIRRSVAAAQRLQTLINDLLAYSRIDTRGREIAAVDCNQLLRNAVRQLEAEIRAAGATVEAEPLPTVVGDAEQLGQVFRNLLSNAVKFRRAEPPLVRVSAQRQEAQWLFSVQDNGLGIEPQYRERIFRVFQRLHAADEYAGTGMGLALGQKIVELHGGRIWVESEAGKGSTFLFTIPLKEAATA